MALLVTDHERGGTPLRLLRLAAGLRAAEVQVAYGCLSKRGPVSEAAEAAGIRTFACDARNARDWRALGRLRRHLESLRPQLVHSALVHANVAARLVCRRLQLPLVTSTATIEIERRWHRWAERLTGGRDARHIAGSAAVAEHVRAAFGWSPERIAIIPPSLARVPDFWASGDRLPDDKRCAARMALGVPAEAFVVAWAGRFDPVKRLELIIEAARLSSGENALFLLAGDGPQRRAIERELAALQPGAPVRLLGWRDDVQAVLAAADAMMFPSRTEGVPNAVLEAMAMGVPVVGSDIPPLRELAGDEGRLLLVRDGRAASYVSALRRLRDDPALRARLGQMSVAWAKANLDERITIERTIELYRRIVGTDQLDQGGSP